MSLHHQKNNKQKKEHIKLLTFGEVDITSMPTGYSTQFPPSSNSCDNCSKILDLVNEGIVLRCGHGYHSECYNEMERRCKHCLEYYKNGIQKNVNEFLKRLNMGTDKLADDENENEKRDEHGPEEDPYDQLKMDKKDNLLLALQKKINEINSW